MNRMKSKACWNSKDIYELREKIKKNRIKKLQQWAYTT